MMSIIDTKRRRLLIASTGLALKAGSSSAMRRPATNGVTISLASYGGTPGTAPSVLRQAFRLAFSKLASAGGGTLVVPAGTYDFGSYSTDEHIIEVDGLRNVVISAYGALFTLRTVKNVMPCLFYFSNPGNVTVAGAGFQDSGYEPLVNWRGMYCAAAEATRKSSGFTMVDCNVDGAVGMFQSQSSGENTFLMDDIHLHGKVKNAYYGAVLNYVGNHAKVALSCVNVRRGCIAYSLKNADIRIVMAHDARAPASNGFISLSTEGGSDGNVENIRINLKASGTAAHQALVHFYHQGSKPQGYMRNIDATVNLHDLRPGKSSTSVFLFDHELPNTVIAKSTSRGWDQIHLSGRISGRMPGRLVSNPSTSTSPGTIYIDSGLASQADLPSLPAYFRIRGA